MINLSQAVDLSVVLNKEAEERAKQLPKPQGYRILCAIPEAPTPHLYFVAPPPPEPPDAPFPFGAMPPEATKDAPNPPPFATKLPVFDPDEVATKTELQPFVPVAHCPETPVPPAPIVTQI